MTGKEENKKIEEYEMGRITCFGNWTSGTFLIIARSLGRKENVSKREQNL